jgi:hypothetical protein
MIGSLLPVSPGIILPTLLVLSVLLGLLLAGLLGCKSIPSLFERIIFYSLCGSIVFSWLGTILAVLGGFYWWVLSLVLLVSILWIFRQNHRDIFSLSIFVGLRNPSLFLSILLILLSAGFGWLFARPAESYFVFNDAAVYTIGAIVLARSGSLLVKPDILWHATDAFLRQFFFTDPFGFLSRHYGPFYQWTSWNSLLEIGFLPLPKVWMALTVWLFGAEHATWTTPFIGVISLAVFYSLVKQLLGWKAGLGSMLLLGISLPQIWFSRYPISEIYAQLFFLGGIYLLVLARKNISKPAVAKSLAVWSGLALATLTILRIEAVLLLVICISLSLLGWYRRYSELPRFVLPWLRSLTVAGTLGLALSLVGARYYWFTRMLMLTPDLARLILLAFLTGAILWLLVWKWRGAALVASIKSFASSFVLRHLPWAIALSWLVWGSIVAYHLVNRSIGTNLAGWVSLYWTIPALILSILGTLWILRQSYRNEAPSELLMLLGSAVMLLIGFSIRSHVQPIHPWAMRRLVPIVMPTLAMTTASVLTVVDREPHRFLGLSQRMSFRRWGLTALSILYVASLMLVLGGRSKPVLFHREREGLWRQLEDMATEFPADAVLLFDNGNISQGVTQVMELVFGRLSLVIQQNPPAHLDSEVDKLIESALAQERPVYLIITNGDLAWWSERWQFVHAQGHKIQVPVLRQPTERVPDFEDIATQTLLFDVYQVQPLTDSTNVEGVPDPITIPAGLGSYPYLRDGFHQWHVNPEGVVTRWTDGEALIVVPWPAGDPQFPADFCLKVGVSGWRPEAEGPAHLLVSAEGVDLSNVQLSRSFPPETLRIPGETVKNEGNEELEIHLISTTWDSSSVGDDRTLGILFYEVQLLPLDECLISQ